MATTLSDLIAPLEEEGISNGPIAETDIDPITGAVLTPVPEEDVISEVLPPLFSFGDRELFRQKLEEKGLEGVTRDVVGIVKQQLPHFNFTYEDLRDGSADVLDLVSSEEYDSMPNLEGARFRTTSNRAMTDEAILALFTDLEDYGKYDPPVQKRNADGTPALDEAGLPIYEEKNYTLSAFAGGGLRSTLTSGYLKNQTLL